VGCGRRLADLGPRAIALVDEIAERLDRRLVALQPLRLEHDLAVPVEPDRGQVGELLLCDPLAHAAGVEVLHPQQEARPGGTGEQPRQQRRAQVAEVQRPSGARRKPAGHAGRRSPSGLAIRRRPR
jgi:hypothetical protein